MEICKLSVVTEYKSLSNYDMQHFGKFIKRERLKRAWSRQEMCAVVGVTEKTMANWEKMEKAQIFPKNLRKIAAALGVAIDVILPMTTLLETQTDYVSQEPVPAVPTFDMPIAAGPWMELGEAPAVADQTVIRYGRFRVHIRGDSMEKTYTDGSLIEFQCLKPDCGDGRGSKLEIGADYYVQRAESATFKRLESFDDEAIVLIAINRKKYPNKIVVTRVDISQMAKAEWILQKAGN